MTARARVPHAGDRDPPFVHRAGRRHDSRRRLGDDRRPVHGAAAGEACAVVLSAGAPIAPAVLGVKANQPLVATVIATGGSHRFVIQTQGADVALQAGQSVSLPLVPTQVGSRPIVDLAPGGVHTATLDVSP
jgi:hypothetical protein